MKSNLENNGPETGNVDVPAHDTFEEVIARSGIRLTPQRRYVYEALMDKRDHPTALEVFMRVKERMPSISLATVYNCLETLTESGVVKHVNLDRAPSRYCPNPKPHGHFFCNQCGSVADVPLKTTLKLALEEIWEVPRNTVVSHSEMTLRGLCATCAGATSTTPSTLVS